MAGEARTIGTLTHHDALRTLCAEHQGSRQDAHTCKRAVVGLTDGSQLPCSVEELSEHGIYLMRSGRTSSQPRLQTGDHVAVHLFQEGPHSVESIIVDGTVVRVEDDGGTGLAIRFSAAEHDEDSPYNGLSSDDWMTEVPEIATLAANARGKKKTRKNEPRNLKTPTRSLSNFASLSWEIDLGRLVRSTLWACLLTTGLALFVLFGDWLGAVL